MPDFLVRAQPGEGHEKTRRNDSQTRWQAPRCAFHPPAVATKVPVPALRPPLVRSKGCGGQRGLGRKGHLMRHYDPARSRSHSQRARLGHRWRGRGAKSGLTSRCRRPCTSRTAWYAIFKQAADHGELCAGMASTCNSSSQTPSFSTTAAVRCSGMTRHPRRAANAGYRPSTTQPPWDHRHT